MEWERKESRMQFQENCVIMENGEELLYLTSPLLKKTGMVKHAFSTRVGGVSEGMFSSMNLSFQRGDENESVHENFKRMARVLGSSTEHMVFSDQTHTTNVRVVTKQDCGKGIHKPLDYSAIDGLVTNEPEVMLVTFYADCVPIYLVDPIHRAIGLCHSGWRGTVGKISQNAIRVMKENYGTRASDIVAAIGPSICQECYEVSEDVVLAFEESFGTERIGDLAYRKENGRYQLDLWRANELALLDAGVPADNIQTPDLCTCCNEKLLFSHRATAGKRGNLAAFLGLYE